MDLTALLGGLLDDLQHPALLRQVLVLLACFVLARFASRWIQRGLPSSQGAWAIGLGGLSRLAFPLLALALVWLAQFALRHWQAGHQHLLAIAVPLLLSLALVRMAVYMLRHVFAPGNWLRGGERGIAALIWIGVALHITGYLPLFLRELDEVAFHIGKHRLSLLLLIQGALSVAVTLLATLWLARALEARVMAAEQIELSYRVVLTKLVHILALVFGVMFALQMVGIDLTVLSVFGGALGVGIGFGLQKIASNYLSGFIILLDRSIHLGDTLTVDNRLGVVTQLTARYLVLKTSDGTEAIIPNDTLITSTVLNHTYSNRQLRLSLPVPVAHGTDLDAVLPLLADIAATHPRVLADPRPRALVTSFSEQGILLELGIWISDPEQGQAALRSELNLAIWQRFAAAGIHLPRAAQQG